jgi:hypothetical protein
MTLDDFLEGIRPELEALPTPEPTAELKARILASRAAGVRTILPNPTEPHRFPARLAIGIAIAAALALLFVPLELWRSSSDEGFASPGVFGHVALAQAAPARSALDPIRLTAPERLRPMALEFERRVTDSAGARHVSHISVRLVSAAEAWRVTSVDRKATSVAVETVFIARDWIRLLARTIHVSPYSRYQRINVWQDFRTPDSVSGHMNTEGPSIGAGRNFARKLGVEAGPYMTESVFPFFLMATPLGPSWSGSASFLGWAVRDDDVLYPIDLRVEAEEQITIPAGRFDCWRLSLRYAGRRFDYWARKSDGLGIRLLDPTREIVLTRISQ